MPVCRFFGTPIGCRNGDKCKFLHSDSGSSSQMQRETCRFYVQGLCGRGDQCWFRHEKADGSPSGSGVESAPVQSSSTSSGTDDQDDICCICQEKPSMYGLLEDCSHICCLACLRSWRDPTGKSQDIVDSGSTKKCPYCRTPSNFVTPSKMFYPSGDPRKAEIISEYKASRARIPCKYFQRSQPGRRHCPFGRDCFYQHVEDDGTEYVFPHGADHYLTRIRERVRSQNSVMYDTHLRRANTDVTQTLLELLARLASLELSSPSDDESSETSVMSRLVGDVISSLEETVGSTASSSITDDHFDGHRSHLLPSILATPEDMASPRMSGPSPLPLTRAFMDSIIEDYPDDSSDYGAYVELDYDSDPYASQFSLAQELDEVLETDPSISFSSIFDMIGQHPRTFFQAMENTVITTQEPSNVTEVVPQNTAPIANCERRSVIEQHIPVSQATLPAQGSITDLNDRGRNAPSSEQSISIESTSSSSLSSIKVHGATSRRGCRAANQGFVTDGRGRVVATTDGSGLDSNSAWFWGGPPPAVEGSPQTVPDDEVAKGEGASS